MGFSFVLYSRLHLIEDSAKLKALLFIIVVFDVTIHVLVLIGKDGHLSPKAWQTVIFFTPIFFSVQETFLSSLYVFLFMRFMRHVSHRTRTKSMFRFLIAGEVVIVCFDMAMVTLNSLHYEIAKTILTPFFYASKLKIEFMVLNRLMVFRQNTGELLYMDSDVCNGAGSPSSESRGTEMNEESPTTRWASDVMVCNIKAGESRLINALEAQDRYVGEERELDDISRLERQYLGQGCILFARTGTDR
jgi:hypothetical protein